MNIFKLDDNPKIAAQMACDKHSVKMPLESGQMGSTVVRLLMGVEGTTRYKTKNNEIKTRKRLLLPMLGEKDGMWDHERHPCVYWVAHPKHPCTLWAKASKENYDWLIEHGLALCEEYTNRYGKTHKTQAILEWCQTNPPPLESLGLTPHAQAMPDECKRENAVEAYREYYKKEKAYMATWKYTKTPSWWPKC
jgi:hypothetical protein